MDRKDFLTHAEMLRERKHKHLVISGSMLLILSVVFAEHFSTVHGIEVFGLVLLMVADI